VDIANKVVIITGAGSGIGAALARRLWAEGARVVLAGRRLEKLEEVARWAPSPDHAMCVATDVADVTQLERLRDRTVERFGTIDVVVNNAGVAYGPSLEEHSAAEVMLEIAVNLTAPIQLTRLCLPILKSRPEALVLNVASMSGLVGLPYQTVYAATKHGLRGFAAALRRELLDTPVRVLTVYPTTVDTEVFNDGMRRRVKELGMPVMTPEHVAEQIALAAKDGGPELVVCARMERMLPLLDRWAPWTLDRMSQKSGAQIAEMVGGIAAHSRKKDAALS
jgi:uncharacterized oxidoreductase